MPMVTRHTRTIVSLTSPYVTRRCPWGTALGRGPEQARALVLGRLLARGQGVGDGDGGSADPVQLKGGVLSHAHHQGPDGAGAIGVALGERGSDLGTGNGSAAPATHAGERPRRGPDPHTRKRGQ
jgi:hypothetical protein